MTEQEKPDGIDKALEHLKDLSPKSKEYHKFIIGLSTGTLVFSVSFLKDFCPSPVYKPILILGWVFLLGSIISGVLLLPKIDSLQSRFKDFKEMMASNEMTFAIMKKQLPEYMIKTWIKDFSNNFPEGDKNIKEKFYLALDKLKEDDLKNILLLLVDAYKEHEHFHVIKGIADELLKFQFFLKLEQTMKYTPSLLKTIRRNIWQTIGLHLSLLYMFIAGIVCIASFSIINFM